MAILSADQTVAGRFDLKCSLPAIVDAAAVRSVNMICALKLRYLAARAFDGP